MSKKEEFFAKERAALARRLDASKRLREFSNEVKRGFVEALGDKSSFSKERANLAKLLETKKRKR